MTPLCRWRRRVYGRPPPFSCSTMSLVLLLLSVAYAVSAHSARFTSEMYNASVPENALPSTAVVSDVMMGMFIPNDYGEIKYRISDGDPKKFFRANARVVGDFCFLELHVRSADHRVLNREEKDLYVLIIRAQRLQYGRRENILGAMTTVRITITDLNDLSPFFLESKYEFSLSEDTPLYSSVAQVRAEDPDAGLNGHIYYSFEKPTMVFAIHPTSGVLSITRRLSSLHQPRHDLIVVAKDRGEKLRGAWPSTTQIIVLVKPVNVFEPQIDVTHLPKPVPKGHLIIVAVVNVQDNDEGLSGQVKSLEIVEGDPDKVFRVLSGSDVSEFSLAVLDTIKWEDVPFGLNLTLKAMDRGGRPRFSYKDVYFPPPSLPSTPAIFTKEMHEVSVIEWAPPGTRVVLASHGLPGTYLGVDFSIVAGNEGGQFQLDRRSGVLSTSTFLDAETRDHYSLTITATSSLFVQSGQQAAVKVKVKVLDANDNTPMIVAPQGIVQIDEHLLPGSLVTTVRAQDYDSEDNSKMSYSLANMDEVPFVIDPFTGEITTTKVLDYETERRLWKLVVRASDWGVPFRLQTEKVISVNVQDVNDNRPQFERVDCAGYVDPAMPLGTEIMTLSAVDFDAGNIISYRIAGGNDDQCFNLDSISGVISLTCDLNDFRRPERILNVTATDGQHFADTMGIRLQLSRHRSQSSFNSWASIKCREMGVTKKLAEQLAVSKKNNENDEASSFRYVTPRLERNEFRPEILNAPREIRVRENTEVGTVILKLHGHDLDSGYNGYLTYAITGGNEQSVFNIDMTTGELSVAGLIDRERLARYFLTISVHDMGVPQLSSSHRLSVIVVDENDNIPTFNKPAYSFFLPENVVNGTNVYELTANDPDEGLFGSVSYSLVTDTDDFSVDSLTGQLMVSRPLDYETVSVYELRVMARDGGSRSSQAYVTVQLIDTNDCSPEFQSKGMAVRVPEDLPLGALVAIVTAHDLDSTQLHYSLDGSGHNGTFSLDEDTAALRLAKPLDFESKQAYNLTVRVGDSGTPVLHSSTFLIVQVTDVNENIHAPVFGQDVVETSIREDSLPHTLVISVPAVDGDLNAADSTLTYSLVGPEGRGVFYIDHRGDIYTSSHLDRETRDHYWLTVRAQDSGTVPRHATLHVYIGVLDVNDNRPLTEQPVYWPEVAENSPSGTHVITIRAFDPDSEAQISFSITAGDPQSLFSIDVKSGEIRTTERQLDREYAPEHVLEVTLWDDPDESKGLSSSTFVVVTVLDENDNSPIFLESLLKVTLPVYADRRPPYASSSLTAEALTRVIAKDEDSGSNAALQYSILSEKSNTSEKSQNVFRIDGKTGVIYASSALQPFQSYELTILVEDDGLHKRNSSCLVMVNTRPAPKDSRHAPSILDETHKDVTILESDPVGHLVKLVEVADEDRDQLWFDIIDGDGSLNFDIGRDKGNIMIAQPLDAEKKKSYNLTVLVTDGVFFTTCQVLVSVLDINDNRPKFSQPEYKLEIRENTEPGTTVFTISASDRDSSKQLVFTRVNTAHVLSADKFIINPLSGDIVLNGVLDREVQDTHLLTVSVKDRIRPTKSNYARVFIQVKDYNDFVPKFSNTVYNTTVIETAEVGTSVLQLHAVDHDKGPSGQVTYSISSGNVGGVFQLDPQEGIITLVRPLNQQEEPEYYLSVRGSDDGSPPKYSHVTVKINVIVSLEVPPRFLLKSYIFEVKENARVGEYVGLVKVSSHLGVVFSLLPDSRLLPFSINPSSGVISVSGPLDYELHVSYNATVNAISMNGKLSSVSVIFSILDVNDNPPFFLERTYAGHISEASPINSVVLMEVNRPLVVSAHDPDSEHNANLVFEIVEEEARMLFKIDSSTGLFLVHT